MAQRMMKFGSRMAAAVPALTVKLGAQSKSMCVQPLHVCIALDNNRVVR